ncbi:hypothetical protein [Metapseudomonas furukawaii]
MILHASIPAANPEQVSAVLAQIIGGQSFVFPPFERSFIALSQEEAGLSLEVYPDDLQLIPDSGGGDVVGVYGNVPASSSAFHLAIATRLDRDAIFRLAEQQGWCCRELRRGGVFSLIEFWVENRLLIELLTPEMSEEYRSKVTPQSWAAMLANGAPHRQTSEVSHG